MAIGTITTVSLNGGQPTAPLFADRISFPGDGAYPTNGTAAFETSLRTKLKSGRTIVGVISEDCGAYMVQYDRANDKLKVRQLSDGAEVSNATDLSGTTFNLVVLSA